ncbi:MAG: response regulator [Candidatus Tectomicrobia bacterium]|nr:response regulator [Candidatus Tectomicrobia bacterium]
MEDEITLPSERRRCPRLRLSLSYQSRYGAGQLEDVSLFGISFRSRRRLQVGEEIELELMVPAMPSQPAEASHSSSLRLRVVIVWCKKLNGQRHYLCGGRIAGVQDDRYQELMAFLFGEAANLALSSQEKLREVSVYRTLAEAIGDPICVIQNERIAYANGAFFTALRGTPDTVRGQLFSSWVAREHLEIWERFLRQGREDGRDQDILQLTLQDGSGRRTEFELHLKAFQHQEQHAYLAVLRDVSARKAFEQQLVQAEKMRALGEMAGGVAHDFNNILGGILGRTQLLLMQTQEAQLRKGLEIIEKLTLDGAKTVRRIQEFTRTRRDRVHEELDLNALIEEAIQLTEQRWKQEPLAAGLSIDLRFEPQPLRPLRGNVEELREVISNLIFNAVDALPQGGRITILTFADAENLHVQVRDNGIGIDEDILWRVFEPFFTTKQLRGSGLGLSMAYSIVNRHGGEISLTSKPGVGTTVNIVFHQHPGAADQIMQPPAQQAEVALRSDIMLIDDDDGIRDFLHDLLTAEGYRVLSFDRGRPALAAFQESPCGVVITDLGIPDISGWDVARQVKIQAPATKIMLITGWGVQIEDAQVRASGIDHVLAKPFQVREILAQVKLLTGKV